MNLQRTRQVLLAGVLLCVLPWAPAQATTVATTARLARPRDLRAVWMLQDSSATCPRNITHTTWTAPSEGTYALPHDTIVQDDVRCSFPSAEHTLIFHSRSLYDDDLQPSSGPPLPAETLRQLLGDTVAKRALAAGDQADEDYMLGYETRVRQCGGLASFEDGSVVFVFRPFTDRLKMEGLEKRLSRGLKWMVVAPREGGLCLYSSDVNGPDDGARDTEDDGDENDGDGNNADGGGDSGGAECFPASAKVVSQTRGEVAISSVRVGESVLSGGGEWTRVVGFSHRDGRAAVEMVEVESASGARVRASRGHYLYTGRGATAAGDVRVGDRLRLADGALSAVSRVARVPERGLFNPHTASGDIVVDGVWATTYTTAVGGGLAHAALAPLRALATVVHCDLIHPLVECGLRKILEQVL